MKQDALQMIQGWKLPIWNAAKKEEGMQKARLLMQTDLFDLKGNFGCFYGKAGSNSVTIFASKVSKSVCKLRSISA